jgi:hypothetical protein
VVKDASEKLGCVYFEEQPTRHHPRSFSSRFKMAFAANIESGAPATSTNKSIHGRTRLPM